jgi:hypothetical protein
MVCRKQGGVGGGASAPCGHTSLEISARRHQGFYRSDSGPVNSHAREVCPCGQGLDGYEGVRDKDSIAALQFRCLVPAPRPHVLSRQLRSRQ